MSQEHQILDTVFIWGVTISVTSCMQHWWCALRFSFLCLLLGPVLWLSLCIDKQSVQHIRTSPSSFRTSSESRATQNNLALLSTILTCYTLSFIVRCCITHLHDCNCGWLISIISFLCVFLFFLLHLFASVITPLCTGSVCTGEEKITVS